ncbi:hypothetical protein ATN84_25450 [Paramesorhizobium deserti]|uniref:Uncharacterized protein n=1 Tax=Paramesorhizobium deserti TaxID=1494590 RepID=A0A135HVC5_9HYPH|nr:hypothetical protein ATN84_25450 [Paramesorhizobium deserti]
MIFPSNRVRIMVATKPIDFRNYAATIIMRSCHCHLLIMQVLQELRYSTQARSLHITMLPHDGFTL